MSYNNFSCLALTDEEGLPLDRQHELINEIPEETTCEVKAYDVPAISGDPDAIRKIVLPCNIDHLKHLYYAELNLSDKEGDSVAYYLDNAFRRLQTIYLIARELELMWVKEGRPDKVKMYRTKKEHILKHLTAYEDAFKHINDALQII